jgi:lipoprotein-releasing system permease protein
MAETRLGGARPFAPFEFVIAMRYLRARRKEGGIALIAIISFLGIMLGVAALIVVLSVMNGFRHELFDQMLGVQSHIYVDVRGMDNESITSVRQDVIAVSGVTSIGARYQGQALLTANGATTGAQIVGTEPQDIGSISRISVPSSPTEPRGLINGEFASFGQGENGGDNILIGRGLAAQLGVSVGDQVTLLAPSGASGPFGTVPRRKAYTVSGIFSIGVYEYDQIVAFMPLDQALLFFNADGPQSLEARVEQPLEIDAVLRDIRQAIGNAAYVSDWRERNLSFFSALQLERFLMRMVMSFLVVIAALNIITGLVMLVKNKGRDIAILRTMGATRGSILRIFIVIGQLIGAIGALLGAIIGILFVTNIENIRSFFEWISGGPVFDQSVYMLTSLPSRVDPGEVLFALVFSIFCSFLAAVIPAIRAARLDPVEALRYE